MKTKRKQSTIVNILTSRTCIFLLTSLILAIFVWEYFRMHTHMNNIHLALDNLDLPNKFPITGPDKQSLDNSELHFKFIASKLDLTNIIVAIIGVVLTYAAFYIQYLFNRRQKDDLTNERFENHYFHFLDVYRGICNTITVPGAGAGKIAFHYMFYEYKALYNIIKETKLLGSQATPEEINAVAFSIFIDGVSYDFLPEPVGPAIEQSCLTLFRDKLLNLQEQSEKHNDQQFVDKGIKYLRDYREKHIKYFDGHRLRLIPYFKYILLIIDHIHQQDKNDQEKLGVLGYLSAEMSEHEIGLLFAYIHYTHPEPKYQPYLAKIIDNIAPEKRSRFWFDNERFIV